MKISIKLNWKQIWKEQDAWYLKADKACKDCGRTEAPEWDAQQRKIQRLVNVQIKQLMESVNEAIENKTIVF